MPWTEPLAATGVYRRLLHRLDPGARSFNLTAPDNDKVARQFWAAACGAVTVWPWARMPVWEYCPACWDVTAAVPEPPPGGGVAWPTSDPAAETLSLMQRREPGKALARLVEAFFPGGSWFE
ncbi:hypothetical protein BS329_15470 [Amycolatopsis coloradensis]|uniref:Uncharacterized protein n=1 Tax=Amycolatopsis coloradensis TaxID=76021 RepID=A0A1R0KU81_9PSEU|nr:hypothetical protein [Amycolatopsis coloradensis]OLZ51664.1 hypothetical protein BS329_15470 [Amycolatopsis coloradensis]